MSIIVSMTETITLISRFRPYEIILESGLYCRWCYGRRKKSKQDARPFMDQIVYRAMIGFQGDD